MQSFWLQFFFYKMNYKYPLFFAFLFIFQNFCFAQRVGNNKKGRLTPAQFSELKEFMSSKNLLVKDTIYIKYDFNKEICWNRLDEMNNDYIEKVKNNFQKHILEFNKAHKDAVAYNFREPGNKMNKLKLWDSTIIIDDQLFLKNLLFSKKHSCGTSLIILKDGTYRLHYGDSHFELLDETYQKKIKNFKSNL